MAKKSKQSSPGEDIDGNVDKIREILFGGQMRDYEQRFDELERILTKRLDTMASSFEKRFDKIDGYARQQVDKLTVELKAERKARLQNEKHGERDVNALTQKLEQHYADLEGQIDAETHELRGALKEHGSELSGLIAETHDELSKTIASETKQIADDKLAREDLAGLLTDLASGLKKSARRSRK